MAQFPSSALPDFVSNLDSAHYDDLNLADISDYIGQNHDPDPFAFLDKEEMQMDILQMDDADILLGNDINFAPPPVNTGTYQHTSPLNVVTYQQPSPPIQIKNSPPEQIITCGASPPYGSPIHVQTSPIHTQMSPTQYTQQTSPIQYTQQTSPIQYTQQTSPIQYTQQTSPIQYTQQTSPIQYTQQISPTQTSPIGQIPLKMSPVQTINQNFAINNSSFSPPKNYSGFIISPNTASKSGTQVQFVPPSAQQAYTISPPPMTNNVPKLDPNSQLMSLLNATDDELSPIVTSKRNFPLLEQQLTQIPTHDGGIIKLAPVIKNEANPPIVEQFGAGQRIVNIASLGTNPVTVTRTPNVIKIMKTNSQVMSQNGTHVTVQSIKPAPTQAAQHLAQLLLHPGNNTLNTVISIPNTATIPTVVTSCPKIAIDPLPRTISSAKKPEGKLSEHRVIEKRYRDKIKSAMDDLKELVVGPDGPKLHKSQVMRKAVDHILHLKKKCKKLQDENMALKKREARRNAMDTATIYSLKAADIANVPGAADILLDSPPGSDGGSPFSGSPTDSDYSPLYSPQFDEITLDTDLSSIDFTHHMPDKARFTLLMMFCVLMFNPFKSLFTSQGVGVYDRQIGSRSLQGFGNEGTDSTFITFASWAMTAIIALFILLKLLVWGEPYMDRKSKAAAAYEQHQKQAEIHMKKGDITSSAHHLSLCLSALGRPLPTSKLDLMTSLAWKLFHHTMHQIGVTAALTWLMGRVYPMTYINRMESAGSAAQCYHLLHEMYLTGDLPLSRLHGANLCLSAVNMAESSGTTLPPTQLARIYLTAAVHVRSMYTRQLHFICRYFLTSARRVVSTHPSTISPSLQWITQPNGHYYFLHGKWTLDSNVPSLFTHAKGYVSPIGRVSRYFYGNLATQALNLLMTSDPNVTHKTIQSEVLQCARLMADAGCYGNALTEPLDDPNPDEVCVWWCSLIKVALGWLTGGSELLHDEYKVAEKFPTQLGSQDNLVKAVYVAYKARKMAMGGLTDHEIASCTKLCSHSGCLLRTSLNMMCDNTRPDDTKMVIQLLTLEWLLQTRLDIWRLTHSSAPVATSVRLSVTNNKTDVIAYQQDLAGLRKLAKFFKPASNRVLQHEPVHRIMTGANPLKTQEMFQRTLHTSINVGSADEDTDATCTDSDQAQALLLSCEYLPDSILSSPGQKTQMLADAAQLYKRVGDHRSASHCSVVLSQHISNNGTVSA